MKSLGNAAKAPADPPLLLELPLLELPLPLELLLELPLLEPPLAPELPLPLLEPLPELLLPPLELLPLVEPPWPLVQAAVPKARAQMTKAHATRGYDLSDDIAIPRACSGLLMVVELSDVAMAGQ